MSDPSPRTGPSASNWPERARDVYFASRLTLFQVGLGMGFPDDAARRAAWQFLYRTPDPTLSDVRRFAEAVGVPLSALVE